MKGVLFLFEPAVNTRAAVHISAALAFLGESDNLGAD